MVEPITTGDRRPVVTHLGVVRTVEEAETALVETMARMRVVGRRPQDIADRSALADALRHAHGITIRQLLQRLRRRVEETSTRFSADYERSVRQ